MSGFTQQFAKRLTALSSQRSSPAWHAPHGGLALTRNKPGLPAIGEPIKEIDLPDQLVLPLLDYEKQRVEAHVKAGSTVTVGDVLAPGILAPANGTISAIEPRVVIHPSHQATECIVINVDNATKEHLPCLPALDEPSMARIERAAIQGLGGAGFATSRKFMAIAGKGTGVDTLLINAVECEPQISCDEALIRSDAQIIITAIRTMIRMTDCKRCILAIEDDKLEAIDELQKQLSEAQHSASTPVPVELARLSAIYPSGAEKVLLQRIMGHLLPSGMRASDKNVLCFNVATVVAAWRAQQGYPLISRIVTVAGNNARNATNVRVRFGTSVSHVLQQTGNPASNGIHSVTKSDVGQGSSSGTSRVRAGGPLSGFDLVDLSVPITATTNCIAVEAAAIPSTASACIRCSHCSDVCPVDLVPQQLLWHASADDLAGAMRYGLSDCIECGCCDVVCPSSLPLTSTFRYARSSWRDQQQQKTNADLARQRFDKHEARRQDREREAQRIREQKQSQLASGSDAIAKALARSRARKKKT